MTETQPAPMGTPETLDYKGRPVRIVIIEGVLCFALEDICEAAGWNTVVCSRVYSSQFPAHGKLDCYEETAHGLQNTTVLTPVGVWLFTEEVDRYRGSSISAWAKREAGRLCPNADSKNPAMFLTLGEFGDLPPVPTRYSGRRGEWNVLRYSDEHFQSRCCPHLTREAILRERWKAQAAHLVGEAAA